MFQETESFILVSRGSIETQRYPPVFPFAGLEVRQQCNTEYGLSAMYSGVAVSAVAISDAISTIITPRSVSFSEFTPPVFRKPILIVGWFDYNILLSIPNLY